MADDRTIGVAGPLSDGRRRALDGAFAGVGVACRFARYADAGALFAARDAPRRLLTLPGVAAAGSFETLDVAAFEAALDGDLHGRFAAAQAAVRAAAAGGGEGCAIVHLIDADGLIGAPAGAPTAIGTMAVVALSRSIALDFRGAPVTSNVVAGAVDPNPDDLAALVDFLAFGAGREVTGQVFALADGSLHLCGQPRPLRIAHRDGGWTQSDLAAQIGRAWRSLQPPAEETAREVFAT